MKLYKYPDIVCEYIKEKWIKMQFLDDSNTYYVTIEYYNEQINNSEKLTTDMSLNDHFIISGSEKVAIGSDRLNIKPRLSNMSLKPEKMLANLFKNSIKRKTLS